MTAALACHCGKPFETVGPDGGVCAAGHVTKRGPNGVLPTSPAAAPLEQAAPAGPPPASAEPIIEDSANSASQWGPPLAFEAVDVPPFPLASLPGWLRDFVAEVAEFTQTPTDLCGMLSLAALSTAVGGTFSISARWSEPLNCYVLVVLPPAERKSTVLAHITEPIIAYERTLIAAAAPLIAELASAYEVAKRRLGEAQQRAAKAKPSERAAAEAEAKEAARDLAGLRIPAPPRLIADDVTPEALARLLAEQAGRLAVLSAEGGWFETVAGRYSQSGVVNIDALLKGHAGEPVRVDRIGRPPLQIERATLTIGLAVQPDVLRGLPEKPAFRGRGLLARFWYCVPVSKVGRRTIEPAPLSDATRSAYADHLRALLAIGPPVAEEGRSRANVLPLTNEAHDLIVAFQTELEPRLAPIGDLGHIADWAGKLTGPVLRVAGLLHCAAHATDLLWREPVSGRTISAAINVGHYLLGHAVAAFARMGASADIEGARRCLAWALTRDLTTFSKRDLFEGLKGRYERVEMLDGPLRVLIERGYIRPEPAPPSRGPGRPPSPVYAVNPLARCGAGGSQNSHYSHKGAGEALSHPVGDSRNSQNVGAGWEEVDDDAD